MRSLSKTSELPGCSHSNRRRPFSKCSRWGAFAVWAAAKGASSRSQRTETGTVRSSKVRAKAQRRKGRILVSIDNNMASVCAFGAAACLYAFTVRRRLCALREPRRREQNILDAVSLPVNRLAFERILSPGWQTQWGRSDRRNPKRVMYLPPFAGLYFFGAQVFSRPGRNFFQGLGNYSRKQFLQDRVLDCPREPQTSFCCKRLGRATRRRS